MSRNAQSALLTGHCSPTFLAGVGGNLPPGLAVGWRLLLDALSTLLAALAHQENEDRCQQVSSDTAQLRVSL
jgi:hypothetical protein